MRVINDQKLVLLIRFVPSLIVAVFASLITIAVVNDSKKKAQLNRDALHSDMMEHQKAVISDQVELVYKQIDFRQSRTVKELKNQAKSRVVEAHQIATNIYNNNPNASKSEVTKMIADALKPIRFYNQRGYFFIFQMDGINVMHALNPHLEGNSGWESVDIKGNYILRNHINLILENGGEAFYRWWYQKPGYPIDQEFEKIGFGKTFEPYDWFIGTGEYVADVESDVKQSLIDWVLEYQSNKDEKVFIIDEQGTLLVHENPKLVGMNIGQLSTRLKSRIDDLQTLGEQGEYIDFTLTLDSNKDNIGPGVAFIRDFTPWGWAIGSSFSLDEINTFIAERQEELEQSSFEHLMRLIIMGVTSILIMVAVSYLASQLIVKRFAKFQKRINDDFGQLETTKNQMQYMALHDPLTGLANRSALVESLASNITRSSAVNKQLAVVFLDLDDFKKVNDLYGHAVGDKLLECLSRQFESVLETHDSVARFGGDEFIFCIPLLNSQQEAVAKVEVIKGVFSQPFLIDGRMLTVDCSIGVSMYPNDSQEPETLITCADTVLYRSKQNNKGSVLFFDAQINAEIQDEYRVEQQLKRALCNNELSVFYQPQLCSQSEKLVGVEALIRWTNRELGFIGPDVFIPLAEENGMITKIGAFIFERACRDILSLSPNGPNALLLSVNVSPRELLLDGFYQQVTKLTEQIGIDSNRITLEVTESLFIHDMKRVVPILDRLKAYGFSISLDDFGTGYSSLSNLNHLSIDELKVDKSFVANMVENAQSNALVKAILAISETYQIHVVAEGVETKEQHLMLKAYGCQCLQGYYFAKPMPFNLLQDWVEEKERA
ncbi:EAL domain-containing protein [Vibrio sp. RE86]|uniref:bifunctional diguanylate cyclase/phosphodiesterase n=1 Tax=Vibrio sp. RE86 TaxID=2607605 RepID=UPI0014939388|nr:EAL domain-containing protein [Vibrio sp. RE86]NOH78399.1 EAL domain-containing protein [Vibrio sp. RE86]